MSFIRYFFISLFAPLPSQPGPLAPSQMTVVFSLTAIRLLCSLVIRGYRQPITFEDVWDLSKENRSCTVARDVQAAWKKREAKQSNQRWDIVQIGRNLSLKIDDNLNLKIEDNLNSMMIWFYKLMIIWIWKWWENVNFENIAKCFNFGNLSVVWILKLTIVW